MRNYYSILFPLAVVFFGCNQEEFEETIVSLENYQVTEGFKLEVIAAEPLLDAPVTMDFDNKGRMWVIEMRGYMPNLEGIGEEEPNGRITIMEDKDNDGVADHAKVFLDSLVLPRAIAHVYGGLLYVEPPNLWFIEIENDQPGKKTLVDSLYSTAGNVEHQPNGLMMNIDNWIYNANSNFRYKLKDGKWLKEPTSYRGQWGISKDDFGRLYYNGNSTQIKSDFVLPNTTVQNKYFSPKASLNKVLTPTERIYPIHATSINRGYVEGMLDQDSMVLQVTSACGPLIYRGGQFTNDYNQNAFTCAPEANLIKRNILSFEDYKTSAKAAWDNKEFLVSSDEGFRPVNLFNGPDGGMYIVDMHRGIIQHKAFISQYLVKHLTDKKLDTIKGMGRILRVTNIQKPLNAIPNFAKLEANDLIGLLDHPNGWIRDRAQQLIIRKNDKKVRDGLERLIKNSNNSIGKIHALYSLEGLNILSNDFLKEVVTNTSQSTEIRAHGLILLRSSATRSEVSSMAEICNQILNESNKSLDLYVALALNNWTSISDSEFFDALITISDRYPDESIYQEAVVNSLSGREQDFVNNSNPSNNFLTESINAALSNKENEKLNPIYVNVSVKEDNRTNGLKLFRSICAACHGPSGDGIDGLAPPLRESEYVSGSVHRLASIILHGMNGPLHVDGKLYELNGTMPGLINNNSISDQDITNIIHFLQNAYVHDKIRTSPEEIKKLRSQKPTNGALWTEEDILKINFQR